MKLVPFVYDISALDNYQQILYNGIADYNEERNIAIIIFDKATMSFRSRHAAFGKLLIYGGDGRTVFIHQKPINDGNGRYLEIYFEIPEEQRNSNIASRKILKEAKTQKIIPISDLVFDKEI